MRPHKFTVKVYGSESGTSVTFPEGANYLTRVPLRRPGYDPIDVIAGVTQEDESSGNRTVFIADLELQDGIEEVVPGLPGYLLVDSIPLSKAVIVADQLSPTGLKNLRVPRLDAEGVIFYSYVVSE